MNSLITAAVAILADLLSQNYNMKTLLEVLQRDGNRHGINYKNKKWQCEVMYYFFFICSF